jgi:hypothetical protein
MVDMRTRASRYSNPRLGAAFESLADVFAPPSGSDLYGYTKAASERQQMRQLGELWDNRGTMSETDFDRTVAALGRGSISGGYTGVRSTAETARRGQDVDLQGKVYDVNSRDRTAISTNAADNKRHLLVAAQTPVAAGATRFVPKEMADMWAGSPTTQSGNIELKPGEVTVTSDGRTLAGEPVPLSDAQEKARIIRGMSEEEQRAIGYGDTPVVETGTGPMTRPQQLKSGTPKLDSTPPKTLNSKNGPTIWDPVKRAYVPAPAAGIDISSGVQNPSAAVGSDGTLGPTKANIGASHARSAEDTTALNTLDLYENLIRNNPGSGGIVAAIRGTAQDAVQSANDFVNAFGDKTPQMKEAAQAVRAGLNGVAPELFDPAIPEAQFLRGTLAYAIARTENPSGEVSRQAYDRAYERLGGGILANQAGTLAQIGAFRKVLQAKQAGTGVLQGAPPRTDTGYLPPPGAAAPAARPRATDANGNMIEYDGQAWVPVK